MPDPIIEADGVGVYFPHNRRRRPGIRELFIHGLKHQPKGHFWAIRDISFSVQPGEGLGVVGGNGAGKSTLLKVIAGALKPDEGDMRLRGSVSLLELRAGLAKELTGRDNVFLLGALHGLDTRTLADRFDEIVEFAELSDAIDTPVRRYSSGMQTRLTFAVAVQIEESILLVDEVLAVGDRRFKKKCFAAMDKMLAHGRTLVLVSHSEKQLQRFCGRGLFLEEGRLAVDGTLQEALDAYHAGEDRAGRRGNQRGGRSSPAKQTKQGNQGKETQQNKQGNQGGPVGREDPGPSGDADTR